MFKLSHTVMIYISGLIWLVVGLMLLRIGVNLFAPLFDSPGESTPLLNLLSPLFGERNALIGLIGAAALIGYVKGRFILGKSARKGVERILTYSEPMPITSLYSPKYFILLGAMIALGVSIKYMGIPNDIRGFIDVAIGIALLTGAQVYFRSGRSLIYDTKNL